MKTVISVIAIFLSLLLVGCTNIEAKTPQPSETTGIAAYTWETVSVVLCIVISKIMACTRV